MNKEEEMLKGLIGTALLLGYFGLHYYALYVVYAGITIA